MERNVRSSIQVLAAGAVILTVSGCMSFSPERRNDPYVYGWIGEDNTTSNTYDPYIEGLIRTSCNPKILNIAKSCVFYVRDNRYDLENGAVSILVTQNSSLNPQDDANKIIASLAEPVGCQFPKKESSKNKWGHTYGYTSCGQKNGYYPSALVANRWNHGYIVLMQRKNYAPTEEEMVNQLNDIRFPK